MPITVEYLESGPLLYYEFSGRITLHDLETLRERETPYFDAIRPGSRVAVVLDLTQLLTIPAELFAPLQQSRVVSDERVSVVGVVGANPYLRALAISLGLIAAKHDFVFCQTRDEALHRIATHPALLLSMNTNR